MKNSPKIIVFFFLTSFFILSPEKHSFGTNSSIIINPNKITGKVNKKLFGNNFISYAPSTYESNKDTKRDFTTFNYGSGIWDPIKSMPVKEVIELAKNIGMSVIRFPGGCGTHHYDWKKTIKKNRKDFLFGLDEFLKTSERINADPIITVSYFTGNEIDAADLVEYLNAPNNKTENNWSHKRAQNGHHEPYNVKYFEIGNEVYHGDHRSIKRVLPEEYVENYVKYYHAMKKADSRIKIGAVLSFVNHNNWNERVIEGIGSNVDFVILHTYPSPAKKQKLEKMHPQKTFLLSFAIPHLTYSDYFKKITDQLRKKSGKTIPIAITEYNGGFIQNKPLPYRHCLSNALLNAEVLSHFINQKNKILMANYWQFSNSYWGIIKSKTDYSLHDYNNPITYIKRPNYYVFDFFKNYFGEVLINSEVKCNSYDISDNELFEQNVINLLKTKRNNNIKKTNLLNSNWKTDTFNNIEISEKNNAFKIKYVQPDINEFCHAINNINVKPDTFYELFFHIKVENLKYSDIFFKIKDNKDSLKIETNHISGTSDWQYVNITFKTLNNTENISIRLKSIIKKNGVTGKAFIKNANILEFTKPPPTKIPYLTVNASTNRSGKIFYLLVINKHLNNFNESLIKFNKNIELSHVKARILNGPSFISTNESKHDNVKVSYKEKKINGSSFNFSFEPHSLTALEIY